MEKDFTNILRGKVVIVGLGNILKGDDGLGPALVKQLQGKVRAACIDAGTVPENYTRKIVEENPDTIVLLDAVHLGKMPGEYAVLDKADILKVGFTTHDISPNLFIEYLEQQTSSKIYLLGVQPRSLDFKQELSFPVARTLEFLAGKIQEALHA